MAASSGLPAEDADVAALADSAAVSEASLAKVKALLGRLQGSLSVHCRALMKPGKEAPRSLSGIVDFLNGKNNPLKSFASEQTRQGASLAFGQLIAHGLEGDLERICSSKAVDAAGKEVEPSSFSAKGITYAKLLGVTLRAEKDKKKDSSAAASSAATNV